LHVRRKALGAAKFAPWAADFITPCITVAYSLACNGPGTPPSTAHGTVAQRVVGEVQDVVTLVVGEVELQHMESFVDGLGQAELADQELDGADAAAGDCPRLGGDIVMDVGGGEDRVGRWGSDRPVESPADFALARGVMAVWNRFHSKSPWGCGTETWAGQSNVP